jgi:DNA-directed RNA polymerase subunit beta
MSKAPKSLEVRKSFSSESSLSKRKFWKPISMVSLPNLIEIQVNSYDWLLEKGIKELFDEINPISDFTEKDMDLIFKEYYLDDPKYDELTAKSKNISFEAPLRAKIQLIIK